MQPQSNQGSDSQLSVGKIDATIAHELKNPLSFVIANLKHLKEYTNRLVMLIEVYDKRHLSLEEMDVINSLKNDIRFDYIKERIPTMIESSLNGIDRVMNIISQLKSVSGQQVEKFDKADINKALESTLNLINNDCDQNIQLIKHYGNIPLIECDVSKINQVFMNILINAYHAIGLSGKIEIITELKLSSHGEQMVSISITDNGQGMAYEVLKEIFTPFYTTKSEGGRGTGLGLYISKQIIESHNGEIKVKSEPGEGTTFTILIPAIRDVPCHI
ncbi:MAG: hypothetical protein HQK65_01550 [Desulfamplus sp.]|nr:hypothetical protein [Desulfamplus sp.]